MPTLPPPPPRTEGNGRSSTRCTLHRQRVPETTGNVSEQWHFVIRSAPAPDVRFPHRSRCAPSELRCLGKGFVWGIAGAGVGGGGRQGAQAALVNCGSSAPLPPGCQSSRLPTSCSSVEPPAHPTPPFHRRRIPLSKGEHVRKLLPPK